MQKIIFDKLISYGECHLSDNIKLDYFAVSLPDLLIWDDDLNQRNVIHCKYMMSLGYYGLGERDKMIDLLNDIRTLDLNHQGVQSLVNLIAWGYFTQKRLSQFYNETASFAYFCKCFAEREVYEPLYLSYCNSVIYHSINPHGVRIRKSTKKITFWLSMTCVCLLNFQVQIYTIKLIYASAK